jgi:hypothetical protein
MRVYNGTYIGVFLEIPLVGTLVPYTVKVNSKGKQYGEDMQFCPTTGEKLKTVEKHKKEKCHPQAYIHGHDDFYNGCGDDTFWEPEYHQKNDKVQYFLINVSDKFHINIDSYQTHEFSGMIDLDKIIKDFEKEYSKYLEYYKSLGYDYKIKWGVINYAH